MEVTTWTADYKNHILTVTAVGDTAMFEIIASGDKGLGEFANISSAKSFPQSFIRRLEQNLKDAGVANPFDRGDVAHNFNPGKYVRVIVKTSAAPDQVRNALEAFINHRNTSDPGLGYSITKPFALLVPDALPEPEVDVSELISTEQREKRALKFLEKVLKLDGRSADQRSPEEFGNVAQAVTHALVDEYGARPTFAGVTKYFAQVAIPQRQETTEVLEALKNDFDITFALPRHRTRGV